MNHEREIRAAIDAGESDGYPSDDAHAALTYLVATNVKLREALTLAEAVLRKNGWPTAYARKALGLDVPVRRDRS